MAGASSTDFGVCHECPANALAPKHPLQSILRCTSVGCSVVQQLVSCVPLSGPSNSSRMSCLPPAGCPAPCATGAVPAAAPDCGHLRGRGRRRCGAGSLARAGAALGAEPGWRGRFAAGGSFGRPSQGGRCRRMAADRPRCGACRASGASHTQCTVVASVAAWLLQQAFARLGRHLRDRCSLGPASQWDWCRICPTAAGRRTSPLAAVPLRSS